MNNKLGRSKWLLFSLFFIIVVYAFIKTKIEDFSLQTNHAVICANIITINFSKGLYQIDYEFKINNQNFKMVSGCSGDTKEKFMNGVNTILVVYKRNKPEINRPLEDNNSFEKYAVSTADT